jgi:hypothetical protein
MGLEEIEKYLTNDLRDFKISDCNFNVNFSKSI